MTRRPRRVRPPILSAAQVAAARALAGWTQQDLADRIGATKRSVTAIEAGSARCAGATALKVIEVFFEAGVALTGPNIPEPVEPKGEGAQRVVADPALATQLVDTK